MKILPKKRARVAEGLHVWISNHFYYSDFGIHDMEGRRFDGRRYVMTGTPGTGFIEHDSESHSYHAFVRACVAEQKPSYLRMLMGREPSFDNAIAAANRAMADCSEPYKKDLLEHYANALTVARSAEYTERVIRGIKDKMGHKHDQYMSGVLGYYKNRLRHMRHDMTSVVWHVREHCSAETYQAYCEAVEAFSQVASCRRIWYYDRSAKQSFVQMFFGVGVFDFIHSEVYLPYMCTPDGTHYYLLPDIAIVARSNTDFDVVPLKTLTVVCQEMAIEEVNESMVGFMGTAASMIKIPEFDLNFYFNHLHPVVRFVEAVDKLKATL